MANSELIRMAWAQTWQLTLLVVGFKKNAGNQPEPQLRIVPSGLGIHLLPLPHDNDQVRLNCQLELSDIRSVEEKELTFGLNREPLTIQVPEVAATKIHLAYDLPLGRTLLIGGLLNKTHEGKSLATLVMLRCTKVDKSAQPSVTQTSSAEVSKGHSHRCQSSFARRPYQKHLTCNSASTLQTSR